MGIGSLLLLAIGLSMDAFAVSVCKGLDGKKATWKGSLTCGLWFGSFQALMPLIGFFLGSLIAAPIQKVDHWIAAGLLALIGGNMIREALSTEPADESADADFSLKTMLMMAIATSIDALAVGLSLSMAGSIDIWLAVALIGCTTLLLSCIGVQIGAIFGTRFEKKAELAGGLILIVLGIRILLEHLGVFV